MCGIAGFAGDFDARVLTAMSDALVHRGPDDAGAEVFLTGGDRIGLAARRLAILDLSAAGHQPMTVQCPACGLTSAPAASVWLTFNGEIYNFPELKHDLERAGHVFASHSDTEVILHLYTLLGPDMFPRLNGMFALAIYDGRPHGQRGGIRQGDVVIARDGIGIKPLYYTESPRGVLFASEMKALLACGREIVERRLDPIAVSQYLAYQWVPAPRTVLASVRKVLPGECLVLRGGRVASRSTFYELPAADTGPTPPFEALVDEFRHRLQSAVARQMRSDVPIGAFLSGGLDSSAIVAMVRLARPDYRMPCYTMVFGDDLSSEGGPSDYPFAVAAARHLNVDLIPVHAGADVVSRLEDVMYALDEPTGDPAPLNAYLIAERAHADGLKVLLSGTGGDDLLGGYGRHLWLGLDDVWDAIPIAARRPLAAWARRQSHRGFAPLGSTAFAARRLVKLGGQLDRPRERRWIERFQSTSASLRRQLLSAPLRSALPDDSDAAPLLQTLASVPDTPDALTLLLRLDQRHFLADHNLNYLDKTTMAFGVEGRVPLLDLEFVKFAASIPSHFKVSGRQGKYIYKKAMEPYLPREIIYRPKSGFGVPLRRWITRDLREMVSDTVTPHTIRARGVFDDAAVTRLIEATHSGATDGAYPLFSILAFETWCRQFLDRPSAPLA